MKKFLSADQLRQSRTISERSLPKRGIKSELPTGSPAESEHLRCLLDERRQLISEEKVGRQNCLLQGEWIPSESFVCITKNVGKHFIHMGRTVNGSNVLFPEEALFLMDVNCMEVYYNGMPLSMEEAYDVLLASNLALEKYQVYAHLSRLGYVIVRHQGRISRSGPNGNSSEAADANERTNTQLCETKPTSSKRLIDTNDDESCKKFDRSNFSSVKPSHEACLMAKYPECVIPCVYGKDFIQFKQLEKRFLPANVSISDKSCVVNLRKLSTDLNSSLSNVQRDEGVLNLQAKCEMLENSLLRAEPQLFPSLQTCDEKYDEVFSSSTSRRLNDKSYSRAWFPKVNWDDDVKCEESVTRAPNLEQNDTADTSESLGFKQKCEMSNSPQCWKQYKEEKQRIRRSVLPIFKQLSTPKIQPLLRITDVKDTASILNKLAIVEQIGHVHFLPSSSESLLDISYDVYLPNSGYKKTVPLLPNHRLVVTRIQDDIPKVDLIARTVNNLADNVALNFAVVDNGDIAFYSFNDVFLPTMISLG